MLYWPNIVGYLRFLTLFLGAYLFHDADKWIYAIYSLVASQVLDGIDGKLARHFDQCSRMGAALDMICDRTANSFIYLSLMVA